MSSCRGERSVTRQAISSRFKAKAAYSHRQGGLTLSEIAGVIGVPRGKVYGLIKLGERLLKEIK